MIVRLQAREVHLRRCATASLIHALLNWATAHPFSIFQATHKASLKHGWSVGGSPKVSVNACQPLKLSPIACSSLDVTPPQISLAAMHYHIGLMYTVGGCSSLPALSAMSSDHRSPLHLHRRCRIVHLRRSKTPEIQIVHDPTRSCIEHNHEHPPQHHNHHESHSRIPQLFPQGRSPLG